MRKPKKKPTGQVKADSMKPDLRSCIEDLLTGADGLRLDEIREEVAKVLHVKPTEIATIGALRELGLWSPETEPDAVFRLAASASEGEESEAAAERTPQEITLDVLLLGAVRGAHRQDVDSLEREALVAAANDVKPRPTGAEVSASLVYLCAEGKLIDLGGAFGLPAPSGQAIAKAIEIRDAGRSKEALYLRHELTPEERADAKDRAGRACAEADELRDGQLAGARARVAKLEEELKAAKDEVKALVEREAGLMGSSRTIHASERKGFDFRDVPTATVDDWRVGYQVVFRLDGDEPEEVRAYRKPLVGTKRTGNLFDSDPDPVAPTA